MKRILILGGDGMMGSRLFKDLRTNPNFEVKTTVRGFPLHYRDFNLFNYDNTFFNLEVTNFDKLENIIEELCPHVIINCVGVLNKAPQLPIPLIGVNALFPHKLATLCLDSKIRVLHLSTDCVFSGDKGNYTEEDPADAKDLYGKTKFLGELKDYSNCLTLRTSIIGFELKRKESLIEWFLKQNGKSIEGFKNFIYSGFTTNELSRIIEMMIEKYPGVSGLYQVSSDAINKYDLLVMIRDKFKLDIDIKENISYKGDKSLDSTKFRTAFNYSPPTWNSMVDELLIELNSKTTDERWNWYGIC